MHVVFPTLQLDQTGGSRVIIEIANGLVRRGHRVTLVVPRASQSHRFHIEANVNVREVGASYVPQRVNVKNPINSLFLFGSIPFADVIVANFYLTAFPVYARTRLRNGARPFYLVQGYEPLFMEDSLSRLKRIVARRSYHLPLHLLVVSNWLRNVIREHHGRDALIVNPGVNRDIFHRQPGLKKDGFPKIILTIGRRQGLKGFTDFLHAVEQVYTQYRDIHLVIIGQESLIVDSPIPYSIVRPGSDEELAAWYNRASVYVHASHYEGFGLPPLEAMSCGTAVVTTDSGGVRDYAQHAVNCLLVPSRNTEQLAVAITTVLQDEALATRLGQAGIETAQHFPWSNTVDQAEAAFSTCQAL